MSDDSSSYKMPDDGDSDASAGLKGVVSSKSSSDSGKVSEVQEKPADEEDEIVDLIIETPVATATAKKPSL